MPALDASSQLADRLGGQTPAVLPSMLACDFANVEREVRSVEEAGATALHLDVMDGHFVPNLSFGLPVIRAIRRVTDLPLDVHLMIDNPADYVAEYRAAGADAITFHAEVVDDPRSLLDEIRSLGAVAGLSLNPPKVVTDIKQSLPHCDLVLVMSVMPGFGGQAFDPVALEKLRWLRKHPDCKALLQVDGGVNTDTIADCAAAGADLLVAGTAVFGAEDRQARMQQLTTLAKQGPA